MGKLLAFRKGGRIKRSALVFRPTVKATSLEEALQHKLRRLIRFTPV